MTVLLLIRHGETEFVKQSRLAGRLPGVPLNEFGCAQAEALAQRLASEPIKAIYSSPIERALQTAQPVAKALGLEVVIRQGLIETEIGEWMNKEVKEIDNTQSWKIIQTAPSMARFPGGESFAESQLRISQELIALSQMHGAKDVIACVSHADPIKAAVAYFLGLPLDLFQRIQIATASITVLQLDAQGGRLIAMNLHAGGSLRLP